jgi:hypothetical protein
MHLHIARTAQEHSPLHRDWVLYNTKEVPSPTDIDSALRYGSPEVLGKGLPPWLYWWLKEGYSDDTRPATSCLLFPLTLGGVQIVRPDGFSHMSDGWMMLNDVAADGPLHCASGLIAGHHTTIRAAMHGVLWPTYNATPSRTLAETLLHQHNLWRCNETYRVRWSAHDLSPTSNISEEEMLSAYGAKPRLYGCREVLAAVYANIMDGMRNRGESGPFFVTGPNAPGTATALRAGDASLGRQPIRDVKNRRPPWLRRTDRKTPTAHGRRLPRLQGDDEHAR